VAGWAAATDEPNRVIQVSIYVDGHKIAQTECNEYREDLEAEGYGTGRHGFRYDFPEPLDERSTTVVAVRIVDTGALLDDGAIALFKGTKTSLPIIDEQQAQRAMRPAAPKNQRELLQLLSLIDPEYGIYELLRRLDYTNWSRADGRQLLSAAPKTLDEQVADGVDALCDHLNELVLSNDFQRSIISFVLDAFPEKRRLLFVHIPKCAGSSLSSNLMTRFPSLDQRIMDPAWSSKERLFVQLRDFVTLLPFSDTIFLRGHFALNYYLENALARTCDKVFTVIRDPIEIALSQANYVMTRMREDFVLHKTERDTESWLNLLHISTMPNEYTDSFAERVCRNVLRNPNIVIPNPICHWLGGGDAQSVLNRLATHAVEITDTTRYESWLNARWGIAGKRRENESIKYLTHAHLDSDELNYLWETSTEDRKLFEILKRRLDESSDPWVVP
jgi:hypothetical protein